METDQQTALIMVRWADLSTISRRDSWRCPLRQCASSLYQRTHAAGKIRSQFQLCTQPVDDVPSKIDVQIQASVKDVLFRRRLPIPLDGCEVGLHLRQLDLPGQASGNIFRVARTTHSAN